MKIELERDVRQLKSNIYFIKDRKIAQVTWHSLDDPTELASPTFSFDDYSYGENSSKEFFRSLVNFAYLQFGILPDNVTNMTQHLEDMRKIAFHELGIKNDK